ncbi:MAG: helix-turn-helix transcriptional regulator [Thiobacillus sp.]|jgi:DNA-binding XRE family transcriptional regulator|uniref:helix-turn-helix transcriptional regulator n=1 Tax=Thiobacillus sp. TaxID=924 RepID=UPI0028958E5B|nr:helix-turn-helix transcriptional regulator [Thiobacillus sp.]MDT3707636.1 helix-turn-helix transcriptional regulator [Thiobacillus sp.]
MAKKPDNGLPARAADSQTFFAMDSAPRLSLKDLRKGARQTQENLAAALAVGQDTISRLEKRSDMLLSTLRHYVESVGGQLTLVATFPGQAPVVIEPVGEKKKKARKGGRDRAMAQHGKPGNPDKT